MRFTKPAAVAAFVPFASHLVDAAPRKLEISTLGGAAFRIEQAPNPDFYYGNRRGPIALARAYSKFGQQIPDDLLGLIDQILGELGLLNGGKGNGGRKGGKGGGKGKGKGGKGGNAGAGGSKGNGTTTTPGGGGNKGNGTKTPPGGKLICRLLRLKLTVLKERLRRFPPSSTASISALSRSAHHPRLSRSTSIPGPRIYGSSVARHP